MDLFHGRQGFRGHRALGQTCHGPAMFRPTGNQPLKFRPDLPDPRHVPDHQFQLPDILPLFRQTGFRSVQLQPGLFFQTQPGRGQSLVTIKLGSRLGQFRSLNRKLRPADSQFGPQLYKTIPDHPVLFPAIDQSLIPGDIGRKFTVDQAGPPQIVRMFPGLFPQVIQNRTLFPPSKGDGFSLAPSAPVATRPPGRTLSPDRP